MLQEKAELLKALWNQDQLVASTVLPLVADSRSSYVGQMQRLEQLADKDGDSDWNVPDSRTDLKWHAMVRLYNAFCVHAVLPRFKLSTSLPPPLANYLHTLVKGATEEVRQWRGCGCSSQFAVQFSSFCASAWCRND